MAVHRERVDPVRPAGEKMLVHRRWILPDDLERAMPLTRIAPLWRGLAELDLLNVNEEALLERLVLPPAPDVEPSRQDLPAIAAAGALLGGGGAAISLSQMVWLDDEVRRDPYAEPGERDEGSWRDYTLYAVAHDGFLLMPLKPSLIICAACGAENAPLDGPSGAQGVWPFGQAALLDLARPCPSCKAALDVGRDKTRLHNGAVFLLEEACARAAFSIEMPAAPEAEELPDAKVSRLLIDAFGGTDELADDQVPAA
jgi:hypothetical protein